MKKLTKKQKKQIGLAIGIPAGLAIGYLALKKLGGFGSFKAFGAKLGTKFGNRFGIRKPTDINILPTRYGKVTERDIVAY